MIAKLNGAVVAARNTLIAMVIGALLVWLIQSVRAGDVRRIDIVEVQNVHQDSSIARLNGIVATEVVEAARTRSAIIANQELIMDVLNVPKRMRARIDSTRWR